MNTANKLTILRVFLIPVFIALLYIDFGVYIAIGQLSFALNITIALFVFMVAGLTDLADGMIARRRNQVTDFGKFMDPLADKVLVFAAMLWFIEADLMPAWLVLIVILREFFVTGIRLVAAAKGDVIAASMLGKLKTTVTMTCIIGTFLVHMLIPEARWLLATGWVLIGVATVVSGIEYFIKNKEIMRMDK